MPPPAESGVFLLLLEVELEDPEEEPITRLFLKRLNGLRRFFGVSLSRTLSESELLGQTGDSRLFLGLLIGGVVITKALKLGGSALEASEAIAV